MSYSNTSGGSEASHGRASAEHAMNNWGSWHVYSHNRLCCLSHKYNILYVFYHTCWSSTVWLIYLMNACDVFSHSDSQKSDSKCTLEPRMYRTIPSMWLCFIPLAQCVEGSHRQRKASARLRTCTFSRHLESEVRQALSFTCFDITVLHSNKFIIIRSALCQFWHGFVCFKYQTCSFYTRHLADVIIGNFVIQYIKYIGKSKLFYFKKETSGGKNSNNNPTMLNLTLH